MSLYRIEEELENVARRTKTRLATIQGTSLPVHQTITPILHVNDAQEQLPVNDAPIPDYSYITFTFGFCIGILLLYTAMSFAYLKNCVCSCTCA